jgi:type I restriction enzyme S subunit
MSLPRYPNYKDSGAEWLGEVPEHWEVKRVRFVAQLNPSKSELSALARDTAVSFVPMDAIGEDGSLSLDKEKPISEVETGYTYFRNGDVTVAKITPCYENGKGALMQGLLNGIGFGTTELIVVRPNSGQVTGTYLHYLFISPDFRGLGESHMYGAGGQKRIPDDFVRNFATAFPPVREQTQIAAFLDRETAKIDELVAEQRRLVELLKEKRQAVISHAVTRGLNPDAPLKPSGIEWLGDVPEHWRVGKCGFYLSILSGYAFPSTGFSTNDSDTRLLRGINVGVARLKWDEVVYWNRSTDDGLDDYEMQAGDLVIGMDRPLISEGMRVAKVKDSDLPCLLLQRVASLKTGPRLNSDYLLHLLSSEMFVAHFSPTTTGVSVPHISPDQINNFVVPLPPMSEQSEIVGFIANELAKFDTLTTEAQRAIDLLQERRTALISAAVTGQIDVRGTVAA